MNVNELISQVYFHDSSIIALIHDDNNLILRINLCMWKQKNYVEGESELKEMSLIFNNVKKYLWESEKKEEEIDYDTILDFTYTERNVKIVLDDEEIGLKSDNISIIKFECESVDFIS